MRGPKSMYLSLSPALYIYTDVHIVGVHTYTCTWAALIALLSFFERFWVADKAWLVPSLPPSEAGADARKVRIKLSFPLPAAGTCF